MSLTVTDLFCGAGGSSSGAVEVPGVIVRMAANHWDLAIETHNTNHPDTDHDSADISQVDPRRYPRTDILWASPECTNHSQAKGKKRATPQAELDLWEAPPLPDAAAERSRATMWDVPRFGNHHALLMRNNTARGDQGQMSTPVREAMRTVTTAGHQSLLAPASPISLEVDDCEFRMLTPDEIKRGMAFAADYVLLGNKREQVRLAGNAVTPPAARDLIAAVAESLGSEIEVAA